MKINSITGRTQKRFNKSLTKNYKARHQRANLRTKHLRKLLKRK